MQDVYFIGGERVLLSSEIYDQQGHNYQLYTGSLINWPYAAHI